MKGDIAFVGFMMTADEWQELDGESRAQLIAVATRRVEPASPRRFPEGTGKHEVIDFIDAELEQAIELLDDDLGDAIEPPTATQAAVEAVPVIEPPLATQAAVEAAPVIDDDLDFSGL